MVINNKIAFIPIPKNASWSVEDTCVDMGLELSYPNKLWENRINSKQKNTDKHIHTTVSQLVDVYGNSLEYFCIIRNSTDRLVSAWKFFIEAVILELPHNYEAVSIKLKKLDNDFLIEFIKENHLLLQNSYNSPNTSGIQSLHLLFDKMEILSTLKSDLKLEDMYLNERYVNHIITFTSQYNWILSNIVNVKQFNFENLKELEDYIANKLDVDFKLKHINKTTLDYSAVHRTTELELVVEKYIDNINFQKKTLI